MTRRLVFLAALAAAPALRTAHAIDFNTEVKPILEAACTKCHGAEHDKGDLRLHTLADAMKVEKCLVPGKPEESKLYTSTILPKDDDDIMPPVKNDKPLAKEQTEKLKAWIAAGAKWPDGVTLDVVKRIDFNEDVRPILEQNCLGCHNPDKKKGDLDMSTKATTLAGGDNGVVLVPFNTEKSPLYKSTTLPEDDDDVMPPKKSGLLSKDQIAILKAWIEQGAIWPDDAGPLLQKEKQAGGRPENPDNLELVKKIHARIVETSAKEGDAAAMKEYTSVVPKTGAKYTMTPIKAGEFLMGSPASEKMRKPDEGPQVKVKVDTFYMGKFEVTWDEYKPFMITPIDRYKDGAKKTPVVSDEPVDVVSSPTSPYMEMSFGMGQDGFPAISMTEHSALKYCQWLSAQTGHFYRLPTEAEWEYACRAGTTTAYFFGDGDKDLGDYAWFFDNSPDSYQQVGKKKPNPWGLHDMLGNVVEWVLDQYSPGTYAANGAGATNPWVKPSTLYPRVARGGSWYDNPEDLRCAARKASSPAWKQQDPQLPKSIWYHTDAKWLGFRLCRPLKVPTPEEMFEIWNCGRRPDTK